MMLSTYRKNRGLSLIEMMVSMVLGLFLVGGLTSMYLNSRKSDKIRTAVSDIEENARLTLNKLRSAIEHAGYKSIENIPLDKPFYTPGDGALQDEHCKDGGSLIVNNNLLSTPSGFSGYTKDGDIDSNESDQITVIYRADYPSPKPTDPDYPHSGGPIYFDCGGNDQSYANTDKTVQRNRQIACSTDPDTGMSDPWKSRIYNGLYVKKADKTLRCLGSRSSGSSASLILADNIENMQIRYGVTITDNTGKKQTMYKKATDVETSKEWESVTSVQIALLVGSVKDVLDQKESHNFDLLDEQISIAADRKIYRKFTTTINLPNRNRRELQQVTRTSAAKT